MEYVVARLDVPCPLCGGTEFETGRVQSAFKFIAQDAPLLQKWFTHGGYGVIARLCLGCGNIQLFMGEKR